MAGHAGVLDGREVTGPRGLLGMLRGKFGKARWVERRWVKDGGEKGKGEVWTSGESDFPNTFSSCVAWEG